MIKKCTLGFTYTSVAFVSPVSVTSPRVIAPVFVVFILSVTPLEKLLYPLHPRTRFFCEPRDMSCADEDVVISKMGFTILDRKPEKCVKK